ncbi:hypothetical protein [Nocardia rosealba]|uniref:hypothetical protein n=1 Tax=Nocardia TaxID=1817 RepID=UPI001CD9C771|nr:hypothetical protein [Nocardia rosealba]MCA2208504.1 hypothetical protein [Nocardia rosealba]
MGAGIVATLLVGVGILHIVPGVVALSPRRASTAYGTVVTDRDLELLLRHRAVLLAMVGFGLVVGAVVPAARALTITAGIVSTATFLVLTAVIGPGRLNARTLRVARADVIALVALVGAGLVALAN